MFKLISTLLIAITSISLANASYDLRLQQQTPDGLYYTLKTCQNLNDCKPIGRLILSTFKTRYFSAAAQFCNKYSASFIESRIMVDLIITGINYKNQETKTFVEMLNNGKNEYVFFNGGSNFEKVRFGTLNYERPTYDGIQSTEEAHVICFKK